MHEIGLGRAAAVAVPIIVLLLAGLFGISLALSVLLGFPISLGLPFALRVVGGVLVIVGLAVAGWTFRYRHQSEMLVSSYFTFTKLFERRPIADRLGRKEPLVIVGPQKYTRNPLYFGVIVITFGWALGGGYTFVLVAALVLSFWFRVILIPFEERELSALFGEDYARYRAQVPMLVPFTMRKKAAAAQTRGRELLGSGPTRGG